MAVQVDRELLDEFCSRLFRVLDGLGLLPRRLAAKPSEYEKFSRRLFEYIRGRGDVEAGFQEWESSVLRAAEFRREDRYPEVEALRQWMIEHADLFRNRANMQHLKTSLYARVFRYLYARRVLVNAYCMKHRGNQGALDPEFLTRELPGSVSDEVQKLKDAYRSTWEAVVLDARQTLLDNAAYYAKVLSNGGVAESVVETVDDEELETDQEEV